MANAPQNPASNQDPIIHQPTPDVSAPIPLPITEPLAPPAHSALAESMRVSSASNSSVPTAQVLSMQLPASRHALSEVASGTPAQTRAMLTQQIATISTHHTSHEISRAHEVSTAHTFLSKAYFNFHR